MAKYKDRIEAEYEAIEKTLSLLPNKPISQLSQGCVPILALEIK